MEEFIVLGAVDPFPFENHFTLVLKNILLYGGYYDDPTKYTKYLLLSLYQTKIQFLHTPLITNET